MQRKRTSRSPSNGTNRRTNGNVTAISVATPTVAPYAPDARWQTPSARRRTDVFVVDVARPIVVVTSTSADDPLLLTA